MNERIKTELDILGKYFKKIEYIEEGQWVLIEEYLLPENMGWNQKEINACFQIPVAFPGAPPYGFYVPSGLLINENPPKTNYQDPSQNKPPFSADNWAFFSWVQELGWKPTDNPRTGSNILGFVRTFRNRFLEGI